MLLQTKLSQSILRKLNSFTHMLNSLIWKQRNYWCLLWFNVTSIMLVHLGTLDLQKRTKSRLQVAQNTVIRFMLNPPPLPPRTHIRSEEFQSVCLLPVEHIVDQLNNMHKIFHDKAPEYMKCEFQLSSNGHGARYTVVSQYSLSQE